MKTIEQLRMDERRLARRRYLTQARQFMAEARIVLRQGGRRAFPRVRHCITMAKEYRAKARWSVILDEA